MRAFAEPQQLLDPVGARPLPRRDAYGAPVALLERVLGEVFAHELIEPTERQRVARTRADREVGG